MSMKNRILAMTFFLFGLAVFFFLETSAFALSDGKYRAFIKSSQEFRSADAEMTAVWKRAFQSRKRAEGMSWRELQDDQRDWVAKGRDDEARTYIEQGMREDLAYAKVTRQRAEYLRSFLPESTHR
ncbi:MAG: DUF1311 domain-containing protein [Desulfovibrio sp.]|nr:DUF1311 domain-containing protein [Desulfovibrio sp.]